MSNTSDSPPSPQMRRPLQSETDAPEVLRASSTDTHTHHPVARGASVIKSYLQSATTGPGVYRMLADDGAVLYVGKAKNIRKRITSYSRDAGQPNRIQRMIAQTASMVFVSTHTETEALLLEANYIK